MNNFFNKNILKIDDTNELLYPEKLKNINDRPKKLYYVGDINLINQPTIAIIGSRNCSKYGRKIAISLAYELSMNGFIVVSGGARGIDSFANYRCYICSVLHP